MAPVGYSPRHSETENPPAVADGLDGHVTIWDLRLRVNWDYDHVDPTMEPQNLDEALSLLMRNLRVHVTTTQLPEPLPREGVVVTFTGDLGNLEALVWRYLETRTDQHGFYTLSADGVRSRLTDSAVEAGHPAGDSAFSPGPEVFTSDPDYLTDFVRAER
jgi:hypothetical protein